MNSNFNNLYLLNLKMRITKINNLIHINNKITVKYQTWDLMKKEVAIFTKVNKII
jgi:hypothetical protein